MIQIDYTELCNKLGLKGEASARASWHSVKKKLFEGQAMSDTTAKPKTPRKAATPRAKKTISKATVAAEDDEDEAVADATSPGDVEADAGADAGADDGGDGTGTATQGETNQATLVERITLFQPWCCPLIYWPWC